MDRKQLFLHGLEQVLASLPVTVKVDIGGQGFEYRYREVTYGPDYEFPVDEEFFERCQEIADMNQCDFTRLPNSSLKFRR